MKLAATTVHLLNPSIDLRLRKFQQENHEFGSISGEIGSINPAKLPKSGAVKRGIGPNLGYLTYARIDESHCSAWFTFSVCKLSKYSNALTIGPISRGKTCPSPGTSISRVSNPRYPMER